MTTRVEEISWRLSNVLQYGWQLPREYEDIAYLLAEAKARGKDHERCAEMAAAAFDRAMEAEALALSLAEALSRCALVLSGEQMTKNSLIDALEEARAALSSPALLKLRGKE